MTPTTLRFYRTMLVQPGVTEAAILRDGVGELRFSESATKAQKDAASAVLAGFDWSPADDAAAEKQRQINDAKTLPLRDKAVILAVAEVLGIQADTLIAKVEAHITTEAAKT